LRCYTLPTGAILTVAILTFGLVSGAHFNPAVSLAFAIRGELPWSMAGVYISARLSAAFSASGSRTQLAGTLAAVGVAHWLYRPPSA
jgi:glycerol uptake facilitator-like aquaporin